MFTSAQNRRPFGRGGNGTASVVDSMLRLLLQGQGDSLSNSRCKLVKCEMFNCDQTRRPTFW